MLPLHLLSLFCALLLSLPLLILFSSTTTTTSSSNITGVPSGNPRALLLSLRAHGKLRLHSFISWPSPPQDDDSLLSMTAHVKSKPTPPTKLAFMFLTTTPLPFAPLWELYFNQTSKNLFNIYVHADPRFQYDPPFAGVFAHRVIHSKPTERNTQTLVSAARRLLAHALLDDSSNSMFVLLSPTCIPLHSFNFTYRKLMNSRKSFIEILKDEVGAYDRWAARGPEAMLPEVTLENFRIGSQFWTLTRKHARMVVSDRQIWPKFNQPCLRLDTCYPEENYFPTLLSMWDERGCVPATLTHVDWEGREDGHPRTYEAWEVGSELIKSLRKRRPRYGDIGNNNSDWSHGNRRRHDPLLFARKFSPESMIPLLGISREVIFKD